MANYMIKIGDDYVTEVRRLSGITFKLSSNIRGASKYMNYDKFGVRDTLYLVWRWQRHHEVLRLQAPARLVELVSRK